MDLTGIIIFYLFVVAVYSYAPESIRPTTWWGWICFIILMFFVTPFVAVPTSIIVCLLFDN